MTRRTDRSPSDEFTTVERRLLDLLCAGDDATSARSQLVPPRRRARRARLGNRLLAGTRSSLPEIKAKT